MNKNNIHIGDLIRQRIDESGQKIVWFAEQMGCERTKINRILKSKDLHTDTLFKISKILKHDFFAVYSKHLSEINN